MDLPSLTIGSLNAEPSLNSLGAWCTVIDKTSCLEGKPQRFAMRNNVATSSESKNFFMSNSIVSVWYPSSWAISASSALSSAAITADAPALAESFAKALSCFKCFKLFVIELNQ